MPNPKIELTEPAGSSVVSDRGWSGQPVLNFLLMNEKLKSADV